MARSAGRDLTPSEKWDKQYDEMIRSLLILGAVFLFAMMVIRGYGNRRDPEAPIILMPGKEFGNPKYTTPHVASWSSYPCPTATAYYD
jgi:hypothetical protein